VPHASHFEPDVDFLSSRRVQNTSGTQSVSRQNDLLGRVLPRSVNIPCIASVIASTS
jgi:hypothetical protein